MDHEMDFGISRSKYWSQRRRKGPKRRIDSQRITRAQQRRYSRLSKSDTEGMGEGEEQLYRATVYCVCDEFDLPQVGNMLSSSEIYRKHLIY